MINVLPVPTNQEHHNVWIDNTTLLHRLYVLLHVHTHLTPRAHWLCKQRALAGVVYLWLDDCLTGCKRRVLCDAHATHKLAITQCEATTKKCFATWPGPRLPVQSRSCTLNQASLATQALRTDKAGGRVNLRKGMHLKVWIISHHTRLSLFFNCFHIGTMSHGNPNIEQWQELPYNFCVCVRITQRAYEAQFLPERGFVATTRYARTAFVIL